MHLSVPISSSMHCQVPKNVPKTVKVPSSVKVARKVFLGSERDGEVYRGMLILTSTT